MDLTEAQLAQFDRFRVELLDWNTRINLTSIIDPVAIQSRHFLDSLTALAALTGGGRHSEVRGRIVDVGSGPGIPGIPLAIVLPLARVTLVEATQKKCRFLDHAVGTLGLMNVEVICGRSEEVAARSDRRELFDVAIARALAPLPTLVELCLPFVRVGGKLIAMKKLGIEDEVQRAQIVVAVLGGRLLPPIQVRVPILDELRQLVVVEKIKQTPRGFPRRAGLAGKAPIGAGPVAPPGLQKSSRRPRTGIRVLGSGDNVNRRPD
ncbi:MAG TPA: 16S rRNA (guanine(527)-N(7))-methyltransferase RsmG [Chloroflexota bacterium]|nr:16S rRNA (guanine(527)-N(7))-methyltransferase RsmG [Chloroflexota bacterium]